MGKSCGPNRDYDERSIDLRSQRSAFAKVRRELGIAHGPVAARLDAPRAFRDDGAMIDPWLTASELSEAYRSRRLSPVEVSQAALARIEALEPSLNAMVHVAGEATLEAARASEARWRAGAPLSDLDGVPVTVKDNILVAGMPATWGSRVTGDASPEVDELPVARLREAGAVILGKTNVPEFTLEGYTANARFGVTRNPFDPRLTPGGSSGGSVASVAAAYSPLSLATDGGGSIRRPASHTGLVGLKPSTGRVPRLDGYPGILLDCEVAGPIARGVADLVLADRILSSPDPRDAKARIARGGGGERPRRIAYLQRFPGQPLDPQIAASTDAAASALEEIGCAIEPLVDLPFSIADLGPVWAMIGAVGVAHLRDHFGHERFDALAGGRFLTMAGEGARVPASAYLAGIERIADFRRLVTEAFARFDAILTPAAAALPWPADEPYPPFIDGQPVGPRGHAIYTGWVNLCGHPGLALPATPSREGLPIGIQIVGRFGADEGLLALAADYESARPWRHRRPWLDGDPAHG
jgi:aspartyl-tRNA(Asn)/glutamyl-tRNA(Gln) amidotransferase subunit A